MDRFELEQAITQMWSTSDDLDLLLDHVVGHDDLTTDQIANTLMGLKELHNMRVQRVFDIFEALIHDGQLK